MWLSRFSIRHPKTVLGISFIVTAAVAPGMARLRLRTDGHALVPAGAPEIRADQAIRDEFGVHDSVVLFIESPHADGIFNAHTLALVHQLTQDLGEISGIITNDVVSLATEPGHRVYPGTLNFRRLLDPLPQSHVELQTLRDDLREIKLYTGTFASADERSAAILAGIAPHANRLEVLARVEELVKSKGPLPEDVHVIGAPAAETLLGSHILEDLGVPSALVGSSTRRTGPTLPGQNAGPARETPISWIGFPSWLGQHVGLVPIALALMFFIFLIGFRSLVAAILPLFEVGAGLVFVFGLMGWFGVPVYLTIAVMPVILTVIGVADEIHVFAHYAQKLRENPNADRLDVLEATTAEMDSPILLTSVTTAVGFLSFALSPIAPVQAFGIFTAIGVLFCMFWSLSAIPASLAIARTSWFLRAPRGANGPAAIAASGWFFGAWARGIMRVRRWVIFMVVGIIVAVPWGIRRIGVQDSWIDGFAADSTFRRAIERFNKQFLGMHVLLIRVETQRDVRNGQISAASMDPTALHFPADLVQDPASLPGRRLRFSMPEGSPEKQSLRGGGTVPRTWESWITGAQREAESLVVRFMPNFGPPRQVLRLQAQDVVNYEILDEPFMKPAVLERIEAFEEFVAAQREDTVGGVLGPGDYVKTTNLMKSGLKEVDRRIPAAADRVDWLWKQYERIRGTPRLRQVVNETYDRALTTVFLKDANFVDVARLLEKIREYETVHLRPAGLRLEFGGDVAVSQSLISAIVSTQVRSLVGSVLGAFVMMVLLGRSLKLGLLCILPCSLSVMVNFAFMGWYGMPLGVATSMFAAMTLGIADDFAIHLAERHRFLRRSGMERREAVVEAVRTAGPAILIDALAVGLGFGVLTLSQVPANARLGALVLLSLAGCFLATMALLPAILSCGNENPQNS